MRAVNIFQSIYQQKNIFCLSVAIVMLIMPSFAFAQGDRSPTSSGDGLMSQLLNGQTSPQSAINTIATGANTSAEDARGLLSSLMSNSDIPIPTADNLLELVASGEIPPSVAQVLAEFDGLGEIESLDDLKDFFKKPEVVNAIAERLTGALGEVGLPEEAEELINTITELLASPEAIQELGIDAISETITEALPSDVVDALGGSEVVAAGLSGILGGGAIPFGVGSGGGSCGAECSQCSSCAPTINGHHLSMRAHVSNQFQEHRTWLITTMLQENIIPAMAVMTSQLTATGALQIQAIGTFFDAKHQLETQRLFQKLTAKAHKDYHPSKNLCEIGTNTRSLSASAEKSKLVHATLARRMMDRQLSRSDGITQQGDISDRLSRLELFTKKHCRSTDFSGALKDLCQVAAADKSQINMDVDYTNALGNKSTIKIDASGTEGANITADEENILALSSHLFANEVLPTISSELLFRNGEVSSNINKYLDIRALAAKRSVAQNSFAAITSLKAEGDSASAPFLKAILAQTGVETDEINTRLGDNPSYYAQMEVMSKLLYQNPEYYSNLYDKPVNNERQQTAQLAIEIMLDRDTYKTIERSNAVLATLIEVMAQKEHNRITKDLLNVDNSADAINPISSAGGNP